MQTDSSKNIEKYPQEGELVIGIVSKVAHYGAFVKLEEYPGVEGMVHISEISSKWIKNIREHVKEGQKVIVKVLKIDKATGHVDLSLKSVKKAQKREKTEEYKKEQRGIKLVELAGKKLREPDRVKEIAKKLEEKFGGIYNAFEKTKNDKKALLNSGLPEKWIKTLTSVAQEYIEVPKVKVKGILELQSNAPNGVEIIRNSFINAEEKYAEKDVDIEIKYLGSPNYQIRITALNYKVAEACLDNISNYVIKEVSAQGSGKLVKI